MNWKKALGYGLLLWVIIFAVVSALIAMKFYGNLWGKVITLVIVAILAYWFAMMIKPGSVGMAFSYGVTWVVIALILDFLITTRFQGAIFHSRSVWVGYILVLLAPWVSQMMEGKSSTGAPSA